MANSVRFHLGAKDDVSGPIDRIKNKLDALQKGGAAPLISGVAAGATVAALGVIQGAIGNVTDALGDSVRGAIDEEASLRRLNVAIGENDKSWDGNLDRVNDIIEGRQKLGFADDEQRDSLAKLVSVTGNVNKALELQRTAMDLARLRGMDLATAGDLLGKVYAGNTGILSRYGIQLAKGTSATAALAEIQRRSAGQADAYGETTAGAMEAAGIAVDNLKEDFGKLLMPVIKAGAEFMVNTAIPAIRGVAEAIGEIAKAAQEGLSPLARLADAIGDVYDADVRLAEAQDKVAAGTANLYDRQALYAAQQRALKVGIDDVAASALAAYPAITALGEALGEAFAVKPVPLEDNFAGMFDTIMAEAAEKGRRLPRVFADGIIEARQAPLDAMDELKALMKTSMSETAETTRLLGQLASEELAKGLTDKDPAVRNAAAGARNTIINRLEDLAVTPGTLSAKGMDEIRKAMNSSDPVIAKAAKAIYDSVMTALPTPEAMSAGGLAAGQAWAAGLSAAKKAAKASATAMSEDVAEILIGRSPPKAGPLKNIDVGGYLVGQAWADAFVKGLGTAEELAKMKLGDIKGALADFLKGYGGISGLMGSAGPEMSRERLTEYLGNLNKQLEGTSDPGERLRILQQIAEYTERLQRLQGQSNTAAEDDVETLMGYLDNIDKALLTEKDPDKRAQLIAKWVTYYNRMQAIQNAPAAASGPPATPEGQTNSAASGGQYVQTSPGNWEWQPDVPRENTDAGVATAPYAGSGPSNSPNSMLGAVPEEVTLNVNVTVAGGILDPNSQVAYQIAESIVPAIRRVFANWNLKTGATDPDGHAHAMGA